MLNNTLQKVVDMTKPKQHKTLGAALAYKAKHLVQMLLICAIAFLAVHWLIGGQDNIINGTTGELPSHAAPVDQAPQPGTPAYVMEQHKKECWTGSQPAKADLPGAAIIQFTNGMVQYTTRHWKVDAAFNEVLATIGYGDKKTDKFDVLALCI